MTYQTVTQDKNKLVLSYAKLLILAVCLLPCMAFADDACGDVTKYLTSFKKLLGAISILVVTIAVIFSGYQIAFAHKRIAEVAPIFIGSVLIGAAAEIASMFITEGSC